MSEIKSIQWLAPLRLTGLAIIVAVFVGSVYLARHLVTDVSAVQLGRSMTWLVSGFLWALVLGWFLSRLLSSTTIGRYVFSVSLVYALLTAWNTYQFVQGADSRENLRTAMTGALEGDDSAAGIDSGGYQSFQDLVVRFQADSQADFDRLHAMEEAAYARFSFEQLPAVKNCVAASNSWSAFEREASRAKERNKARLDRFQNDVAELPVPADFKKGLIEGGQASRALSDKAHDEYFSGVIELARFQIEACEFLARDDVQVFDGVLDASSEAARNRFMALTERQDAIHEQIDGAVQQMTEIREQAVNRLEGVN